jgi:hypothetical protein
MGFNNISGYIQAQAGAAKGLENFVNSLGNISGLMPEPLSSRHGLLLLLAFCFLKQQHNRYNTFRRKL